MRGMRQPRHIHFALSCADRFDDDDLITRGIKDLREEAVVWAMPPSEPRVAIERMKTPSSPERSRIGRGHRALRRL